MKGLTLEKLAEIMETDANYLGQCERGERRFSLDKLVDLIEYFGITANDIIPYNDSSESSIKKNVYIDEITSILKECSDNQLAIILNIVNDIVPYLRK